MCSIVLLYHMSDSWRAVNKAGEPWMLKNDGRCGWDAEGRCACTRCVIEIVRAWEHVMNHTPEEWRVQSSHKTWGLFGGSWFHWDVARMLELIDERLIAEGEAYTKVFEYSNTIGGATCSTQPRPKAAPLGNVGGKGNFPVEYQPMRKA